MGAASTGLLGAAAHPSPPVGGGRAGGAPGGTRRASPRPGAGGDPATVSCAGGGGGVVPSSQLRCPHPACPLPLPPLLPAGSPGSPGLRPGGVGTHQRPGLPHLLDSLRNHHQSRSLWGLWTRLRLRVPQALSRVAPGAVGIPRGGETARSFSRCRVLREGTGGGGGCGAVAWTAGRGPRGSLPPTCAGASGLGTQGGRRRVQGPRAPVSLERRRDGRVGERGQVRGGRGGDPASVAAGLGQRPRVPNAATSSIVFLGPSRSPSRPRPLPG